MKTYLIIISTILYAATSFSQIIEDDIDTLWIYGKSIDKTYGKTPTNPIKIGFGRRAIHINRYLNSLVDENSNQIIFWRAGTEEIPGRKNGIYKYTIALPDNKYDSLYFDNFSYHTPKLVMGYGWRERREEYYGEYANDTDTLGTGKGLYFYPNGNIYKGFFKNGKREGLGRLYYPENSSIEYEEGYFIDDKPKGKFKVVKRDGSVDKLEF